MSAEKISINLPLPPMSAEKIQSGPGSLDQSSSSSSGELYMSDSDSDTPVENISNNPYYDATSKTFTNEMFGSSESDPEDDKDSSIDVKDIHRSSSSGSRSFMSISSSDNTFHEAFNRLLVDVKGDGHCFYRACAAALSLLVKTFGLENTRLQGEQDYTRLRAAVADKLESMTVSDKVIDYTNEEITMHDYILNSWHDAMKPNPTWFEYVKNIMPETKEPNTEDVRQTIVKAIRSGQYNDTTPLWADHLDVTLMKALLYEKNVILEIVHSSTSYESVMQAIGTSADVCLLYHTGNHYQYYDWPQGKDNSPSSSTYDATEPRITLPSSSSPQVDTFLLSNASPDTSHLDESLITATSSVSPPGTIHLLSGTGADDSTALSDPALTPSHEPSSILTTLKALQTALASPSSAQEAVTSTTTPLLNQDQISINRTWLSHLQRWETNQGIVLGTDYWKEGYRYVWNNERGGYSNRLQPSPNEEWSRPVSNWRHMVDGSWVHSLLKTHGSDFKIYTRNAQSRWWIDTGHKWLSDPVETKSVLSRVIEDIHQLSGHSLHDATGGVILKDPPVRGHDVPDRATPPPPSPGSDGDGSDGGPGGYGSHDDAASPQTDTVADVQTNDAPTQSDTSGPGGDALHQNKAGTTPYTTVTPLKDESTSIILATGTSLGIVTLLMLFFPRL
jgi:hypothetical protein